LCFYRPDLTGASSDLTSKDLASFLYDSLQTKIAILPKETIVYPGHGAGSSCGKNIGKETFTTIGAQLESNYALRAKTKGEFIQLVLDGLSAPPSYFFADAGINKNGYKSILQIIDNDSRVLTSVEAIERIKNGAIVIDTRSADEYELASIKGSINIGLDGQFAIWAATLLPLDTSIVLVVTPGKTTEAVTRLARVGFDNVQGCIDTITSDFETQTVQSMTHEEFIQYADKDAEVIDVRNNTEQSSGVIKDAHLLPLAALHEAYHSLDKKATYLVHCAGGYRSMIACSLLKRNGFENIVNVKGGMAKIKAIEGIDIVMPELV
jgi:rhodanese-related sulfurtransferase